MNFSQSYIQNEALQRQTDFVKDFLSVVTIDLDLSIEQAVARGAMTTSFTNASLGANNGNPLLPILLAALGVLPAPAAQARGDGGGGGGGGGGDGVEPVPVIQVRRRLPPSFYKYNEEPVEWRFVKFLKRIFKLR